MQTWQRNPQSAEDEHPWTEWFAPANDFRGITWDVKADGMYYSALPRRTTDVG